MPLEMKNLAFREVRCDVVLQLPIAIGTDDMAIPHPFLPGRRRSAGQRNLVRVLLRTLLSVVCTTTADGAITFTIMPVRWVSENP